MRILQKIELMEQYLDELHEFLPDNFEEYTNNTKSRRASEKTIQLAIETVIDIVSLIVSKEKLGIPQSEDDLILFLENKGVISKNLTKKIKQMKGFRNVLVHRYSLIDNEKTYYYLTHQLGDFTEFKRAIIKFLK